MSNTKIKAGQFSGVVGHGTDGYFLMTNGDGTMAWAEGGATGPSVTSVSYPGDDLAADPTGGQTVVLTGTGFAASGMTVSIGGTTANSVAHDSNTQLTITTPVKAAGDYDIVVTNTVTGASGTFVNGISYNGIPTWTTAAGSLGTFASETTISTITLQATEPDGGTITFNITNGTLPTGLSLTGANIDGTTTAESSTTLYSFTIEAIDDENQSSTPRNFSITVNAAAITPSENFTINTYTGNGSTQSIEGKIGTAASFNGSSSRLQLNINPTASLFSASLWVNFNDVTSIQNILGNILGDAYLAGWFFAIQNGKIILVTGSDASAPWEMIKTFDFVFSTNTWYHLVLVSDGATNKLYVNNNESTFTVSPASVSLNGNSSDIEVSFGGSSRALNGSIDQVRIFDKALSSGEVTTLYGENNASSTKSITDIFGDGSGVALYEFEEGAKDTGGVTGYIGAGGIFNGSSSAITASGLPSLTTFSLSFWLKAADPNADTWVIQFDDGANNNSNSLYLHNFGTQFGFSSAGNTTSFGLSTSDTDALFDNNWHNVVLTINGSDNANTKIYVDGSEKTLTRDAGSGTATIGMTSTMHIGKRRDNSATRYLNGSIDQVRIFDKAISSSEVTTLYQETSASATKSTTDIFDDGSGVALYELEGNANDSGRFGSGAIDEGQSAVFNGSSSYIQLSNNDIITSDNFSVSFWITQNNKSTDTEYREIFSQQANNNRGWFLGKDGNTTAYRIFGVHYTSNMNLSSSWSHIVCTLDGTNIKVYQNGSLVDTMAWTGFRTSSVGQNGSGTRIGRQYATFGEYWDGSIDQVRIYSSALSASDVEALASETNVPTANLVAHYKLDGNATDEQGSYNGTATSITYSDPAEFPTYDGTATNVSYAYDGTPTNVSFVGTSFQPDFIWFKARNFDWFHIVYDSIRGLNKELVPNSTLAESIATDGLASFNANGFTISGGGYVTNRSGYDYVAWCWKAGGSAVTNTNGTIASTVSANTDAGFSIVKYDGATNATTDTSNNGGSYWNVGHGLSSPPEMVIVKKTNNVGSWYVGALDGWTVGRHLILNATAAQATEDILWGNQNPTSTTFGLGGWDVVNRNGDSYIAYCFHSVDGYQKVGSYTGTNATNAVTTGFEPRFLMVKLTSAINGQWVMYDNSRSGSNPRTKKLAANSSIEENNSSSLGGDSVHQVNFTSTGFELLETSGGVNTNKLNETYIYLAIA